MTLSLEIDKDMKLKNVGDKSFESDLKGIFVCFNMYKALAYRTQVSFTLCYIYNILQGMDISCVPERSTDVRPTANEKTPVILPSRAKPRPTYTLRSRPPKPSQNRASNTSLSATRKSIVQTPRRNLGCRSPNAEPQNRCTQPTPTHPKTQGSQSPSQDKGIPKFDKSFLLRYRLNVSGFPPRTPATSKFPIDYTTLKKWYATKCKIL